MLDDLMEKFGTDWDKISETFYEQRKESADAINVYSDDSFQGEA